MASTSTARIIIVDDHPIVRQGLAELINRELDLNVTEEADTADEALARLRERPVDLAIVDLSLRGLSGIELIKQIQHEWPDLPVLVLSMHDEHFYAERVLRAGARGYVMKEEATGNIVGAIRRVLRGEIYTSKAVSDRMLLRYLEGGATQEEPTVAHLSDRELEVFQLIGQGYATREIAEMLHLSVKTIESYRANIKDKLQLRNGSELVQQAVQWVQAQP